MVSVAIMDWKLLYDSVAVTLIGGDLYPLYAPLLCYLYLSFLCGCTHFCINQGLPDGAFTSDLLIADYETPLSIDGS